MEQEKAIEDFLGRIKAYESNYQEISLKNDGDVAYIKLYNCGKGLRLRNVEGYLPGKILNLVMHLHTLNRPILLTVHGEDKNSVDQVLGSESQLTPNGIKYSTLLGKYLNQKPEITSKCVCYMGEENQNQETYANLQIEMQAEFMQCLKDMEYGICEGVSHKQFIENYEQYNFNSKIQDPKYLLKYSFPRGESYMDLVQRMEPVMFQCERQKRPVMVLASNRIIRCLYSYFLGQSLEVIPFVNIPQHTLIVLTPYTYSVIETRVEFDLVNETWTETVLKEVPLSQLPYI